MSKRVYIIVTEFGDAYSAAAITQDEKHQSEVGLLTIFDTSGELTREHVEGDEWLLIPSWEDLSKEDEDE